MADILPRKQPVQARARASFAAVLEAAARILVADGPGALNTNAVAERAGVSVGTLYQYFPSKEAILAELVRAMRRGMLADLEGAVPKGSDLAQTARALVAASLAHHRRQGDLAEALERIETQLALDAETEALKDRIHALVADHLAAHGVARPAVAARDLAAIVRGMADTAALAGERDFDDLTERCLRAVNGYLAV